MPLPSQTVRINRPYLVTSIDYQLGNFVDALQYNLAYFDNFLILEEQTNGYASPRLLNWVEPYTVNDINKTLFYTEVNSNIQVGDRVFIVNGYYDSDLLIQNNKYKSGRDGYIVLYVDKCKIVLDIDYTGVLPFNDDENNDDFVKVWKVSTREEFVHVNKQISTRGGQLNYKFDKYQNNIIYADSNDIVYKPVYNEESIISGTNSSNIAGYGVNLGLTGAPGFFVRNGSGYWINISKELYYYGSFSFAEGTYSNNRMKIMSGDFTHSGTDFKEGQVYEWMTGPTNSYWGVDKLFSKPIISKSNFRSGEFYGTFNNGVYGIQEKRIKWKGGISKWNGGTILNTLWENGDINSKITIAGQNYTAAIDSSGNPIQKSNTANNGGRGFNFIIDSKIIKANIENGTIINAKLGEGNTKTTLKNHLSSTTQNFNISIKKGYFEDGEFNSLLIDNSTLINSKLVDSKVINSRIVNSQVVDSVIKDSTYIAENAIKIKAYDEWNVSEYRYTNLLNNPTGSSTYSIIKLTDPSSLQNSRTTHKLFKFYIDKKDYKKLRLGDHFYLKGVNINDNSRKAITFFDKKFKMGTWIDFTDDYTDSVINDDYLFERNNNVSNFYKRGFEYTAYLSTPEENGYVLNSLTASVDLQLLITPTLSSTASIVAQSTGLIKANPNSNYYSIDILVSIQDIINRNVDATEFNFNYNSNPGTQSTYLGNMIDISKAFIIDANFDSGILETSDWNSGYYINYNNDVNISSLTGSGTYRMVLNTINNTLTVTNTQYVFDKNKEFNFEIGDIVYLNSVDYINGDSISRLPDAYEVVSIDINKLTIKEVNTNVLSGLTAGGYFKTNNSKNRYGYLSKTKFYKSKLKSGLFKRPYIDSSLIKSDNYDSNDRDFVNLEKVRSLIISDTIFSNNNNILSSATYLNSFFIGGSDIWQDGIIQNSFLNNLTFSKGVVKESQWLNGIFTNGTFYNSRSFDGNATSLNKYYYDNRIKSYHIDGVVSATISNFRYSWVNGEFRDGLFFKSDWEDGLFKNGLFNYSKFYKGTFSNGVIGEGKSSPDSTVIYNGDITYVTVNNATLLSKDPNYLGATQTSAGSNINWYDGVFNNGIFGSHRENIDVYIEGTTYSNYLVQLNPTASITSNWSATAETSGMTVNQLSLDTPIWNVANTVGFLVSTQSLSSTIYNKVVDTNSPFTIELRIRMYHSWIGDLTINLKAPNGKIINVKDSGIGSSNRFIYNEPVVFTTNDLNPTLQSTNQEFYNNQVPPYLKFRMSKSLNVGSFGTYSFLSNSTSSNELLNSNKTFNGLWELILIDNGQSDIGYLMEWNLTFIYNTTDYTVVRNNNATWYKGIFNGGQFSNYAKWKTGTFNGGRFISAYGCTQSGLFYNNSNDKLTYSWENGIFNDGEFGNASTGDNSTWYSGTFNGGDFKGKLWNGGLFTGGNFKGSSTFSAIGDLDVDNYQNSNASKFVNSYTQSFYGLWVSGIATSNKWQYLEDKAYYINNKIPKTYTSINFDKVLWLSGTFSSNNGTFKNSVWLTGVFNKGRFQNSSFNPYVNRSNNVNYPFEMNPQTQYSFTPNFNVNVPNNTDKSTWVTGDFIDSDFYMSRWLGGNFISGTAFGMIFFDGVSNFMNAYNVIWEGGTWKNGNWYGSNFDYAGFINNSFVYNIMKRGLRNYGYSVSLQPYDYTQNPPVSVFPFLGPVKNEIHVWNLFKASPKIVTQLSVGGSSDISFDITVENPSEYNFGAYYDPIGVSILGSNPWRPRGDEDIIYEPYTPGDDLPGDDTSWNGGGGLLGGGFLGGTLQPNTTPDNPWIGYNEMQLFNMYSSPQYQTFNTGSFGFGQEENPEDPGSTFFSGTFD